MPANTAASSSRCPAASTSRPAAAAISSSATEPRCSPGIDDILGELNYLDGLRPAPVPASPAATLAPGALGDEERRVLECFRGGSILTIDALAGLTGMPAHELGATLMLLEIKRLVAKRVDGSFEAR